MPRCRVCRHPVGGAPWRTCHVRACVAACVAACVVAETNPCLHEKRCAHVHRAQGLLALATPRTIPTMAARAFARGLLLLACVCSGAHAAERDESGVGVGEVAGAHTVPSAPPDIDADVPTGSARTPVRVLPRRLSRRTRILPRSAAGSAHEDGDMGAAPSRHRRAATRGDPYNSRCDTCTGSCDGSCNGSCDGGKSDSGTALRQPAILQPCVRVLSEMGRRGTSLLTWCFGTCPAGVCCSGCDSDCGYLAGQLRRRLRHMRRQLRQHVRPMRRLLRLRSR